MDDRQVQPFEFANKPDQYEFAPMTTMQAVYRIGTTLWQCIRLLEGGNGFDALSQLRDVARLADFLEEERFKGMVIEVHHNFSSMPAFNLAELAMRINCLRLEFEETLRDNNTRYVPTGV